MSASDFEKRRCATRELNIRRRVYPRWVENGKMTQADADKEINTMEAIADDYAPPSLFAKHGAK